MFNKQSFTTRNDPITRKDVRSVLNTGTTSSTEPIADPLQKLPSRRQATARRQRVRRRYRQKRRRLPRTTLQKRA